MLRSKPRSTYNGLTVVLSNPSRFDKFALLSAGGGQLFNNYCLRPETNVALCDIRLADDKSPLIDNTKCLLLLGEYAMHTIAPSTKQNTLNEMRGSLLQTTYNLSAIASFLPQEASDIKSYEQQFNEEAKDFEGGEEGLEGDESQDEEDSKTYGATKRSNYGFWLRADTRKCKTIIQSNAKDFSKEESQPIYNVYPTSQQVISLLSNTKDAELFLDIETDYEEQNLLCFAFSFDSETIYCVPVLDNNYRWAYSNLPSILAALSIAMRDNCTVAHNGANFDFHVLATKYHLAVGKKSYDTMIAMHRCFPDIEKSLGHCTSYWTWQPFHKDTDSRSYFTREHMMQKLLYCGKDVFTMSLIKKAIDKYATTIPGLVDSINCSMASIRPYLITSIQGIRYDEEQMAQVRNENDRLMMQYDRMIKLLIGDAGMAECRAAVKSKPKMLAGSNTQCCNYFHDQLGYPVLFRSKKTGKPSLAKKLLYRLALKHPENPVITLILLFRLVQHEFSSLKFIPWKDSENKIINPTTYLTEELSI